MDLLKSLVPGELHHSIVENRNCFVRSLKLTCPYYTMLENRMWSKEDVPFKEKQEYASTIERYKKENLKEITSASEISLSFLKYLDVGMYIPVAIAIGRIDDSQGAVIAVATLLATVLLRCGLYKDTKNLTQILRGQINDLENKLNIQPDKL